MRVLIYGFGPYRHFKDNITQYIVRSSPSWRNFQKVVFPVRFDKKQFTDAMKKHRPDFVLGLGQCAGGRLLRIERRAVNRRRQNKQQKGRIIVRGGPQMLTCTLRLKKLALEKQTKVSYDAGEYVCNFSMYVILDYLARHRQDARFGFVHIPHNYDRKRAAISVTKVLKTLKMRINSST